MPLIPERVKARFFDVVVFRCFWTAVAAVAVIAALAAGMQQLITVDVGIRNHFSEDDPKLVKLEEFEETYAVSDSVLVVVAPMGDTIFTREALLAVEKLTDALWRTPYATRVTSITNHSHTEGNEDGLIVDPLVDDAALLDSAEIGRIRTIALSNREIAGRLVSRDGRLAGLVVSLALPDEDREKKKVEAVNALHVIVNEQRAGKS